MFGSIRRKKILVEVFLFFIYNLLYQDSPADLRTACTHDSPVVLLEVGTVIGAYFSFLMEIKVELEEQTPLRPN